MDDQMESSVTVRGLRRVEYDRLVDQGAFEGERLELLDGRLVVREPQGSAHATAVGLVEDALRGCLGPGWTVRGQMPIALDDRSEPEPDVAVVAGARDDYALAHPARPALVVEVAESSLAADRGLKAGLYARARVPEYWIVDLVSRVVEVRREPREIAGASYGWGYGQVEMVGPGGAIRPLVRPSAAIPVADLLPRVR